MSIPLQRTLSLLPSGQSVGDLSVDEMSRYLREHYNTESERRREEKHKLRDKLYRDGGAVEMQALIDEQYEDREVASKRKKWARWARFNNVTKRIVNELSVVYQEPAARSVENPASNAVYQLRLAEADIHVKARQVNRMLNLHRALLVGPRVLRPEGEDGPRKMTIDVISPANARLISHPNDKDLIVAHAIRIKPSTFGAKGSTPSWLVWTEFESFMMDDDWRILSETYQEHGLGRMPHVYVSLDPSSDDSPWPGDAGSDLIAADMAIWFTAISLIKEVKSATRQTVLAGDGTGIMRGQMLDSESPIEVPSDMVVTSHDMSMDLSLFRDTADHILEHVANNYGMSAALIKHQGVQSAEARELMRAPLMELRREQQTTLRSFERQLAESMSAVSREFMGQPFSLDGWRIDFAEANTPLTPKEELERFEHEKRLLLTNPVDYLMHRNPDITEDDAKAQIKRNAEMLLYVTQEQKDYLVMSGQAQQDLSDDGSDGREVTTTQMVAG